MHRRPSARVLPEVWARATEYRQQNVVPLEPGNIFKPFSMVLVGFVRIRRGTHLVTVRLSQRISNSLKTLLILNR
jgi:hypothetical protein